MPVATAAANASRRADVRRLITMIFVMTEHFSILTGAAERASENPTSARDFSACGRYPPSVTFFLTSTPTRLRANSYSHRRAGMGCVPNHEVSPKVAQVGQYSRIWPSSELGH